MTQRVRVHPFGAPPGDARPTCSWTGPALAALLILAGCQRQPATSTSSADEAPPAADRAAAAATSDPAKHPAEGADAASDAAPFHLVARTRDGEGGGEGHPRFRVFRADAGEVFVAHGPWLMRPDADGNLTRDPAMIRGIEAPVRDPIASESAVDWAVHSAGGRWPDGLYMATTYVSPFRGDAYFNQTYRWLGDRWLRLDTERPRYVSYPERIATWSEGSVIALRGFAPRYKSDFDENGQPAAEERAIRAAIAKVKPLAVYAGPASAPRLDGALLDFDALPSGELVALVADSDQVHMIAPGSPEVRALALPDAAGVDLRGVVLARPDRGYVFGHVAQDEGERPYLARFDGEAWRAEEAPPCDAQIFAVSWSEREGLFAACESDGELGIYPSGTLWRQRGSAWSRVELPLPGAVTGVVADGPGGAWVTTTSAAFGPKRPTRVLELEGFASITSSLIEYGDPSPTPLFCDHNVEYHFVLLAGEVGGPHEEERRILAQALADAEERDSVELVEFEFRGEPRLGLRIGIELEAPTISRLKAAFGPALGDTYCFSREPTKIYEPAR